MRGSAEQVTLEGFEEFEELRRSHRRTRVMFVGAMLLCTGVLLFGFAFQERVPPYDSPWNPWDPWSQPRPIRPTPPHTFYDGDGVPRLQIAFDGIRLLDPSGEKLQAILRVTKEGGHFALFDAEGNVIFQRPSHDPEVVPLKER